MNFQAPCPFCGEHRIIALEIDDDEWIVECVKCGAVGPSSSTPEGAWKFWNRRQAEKSQEPNGARV